MACHSFLLIRSCKLCYVCLQRRRFSAICQKAE
ncbi:hypothetical protein DH86_00004247 [Scytalidium sp. 3C]|nr:hypothetical protein DH86_00004247 [Scytalidium sp. 3C]